MPNNNPNIDPLRANVSPRAKAVAALAGLAIATGAVELISAHEPKGDPLQSGGNRIDYPEPGVGVMPDGMTTDGNRVGSGYSTPEAPQASPNIQPPH